VHSERSAAAPRDGAPFQDEAFVARACRDADLPENVTAGAVAAGRRMAGRPALCTLAELCRRLLYPPPDAVASPAGRIWR
jgi:hypothetical protein